MRTQSPILICLSLALCAGCISSETSEEPVEVVEPQREVPEPGAALRASEPPAVQEEKQEPILLPLQEYMTIELSSFHGCGQGGTSTNTRGRLTLFVDRGGQADLKFVGSEDRRTWARGRRPAHDSEELNEQWSGTAKLEDEVLTVQLKDQGSLRCVRDRVPLGADRADKEDKLPALVCTSSWERGPGVLAAIGESTLAFRGVSPLTFKLRRGAFTKGYFKLSKAP